MTTQFSGNGTDPRNLRITVGPETRIVPVSAYDVTCEEMVKRYPGKIPQVVRTKEPVSGMTPKSLLLDHIAEVTAPTAPKSIGYCPDCTGFDPNCVSCGGTIDNGPTSCGDVLPDPFPVQHSGEYLLQAIVDNRVDAPAMRPVAAAGPMAVAAGSHDILGQARSETDLEAARAAGFAPAQTVYTRGTRVNSTGVANARKFRAEYEALPLVTDYCPEFVTKIEGEKRKDVTATVAEIRMNQKGDIHRAPTPEKALQVEARALPSLCTDLKMPSAGTYLSNVWPELRAANINVWTEQWAQDEKDQQAEYEAKCEAARSEGLRTGKIEKPETETLVIRTRVTGGESRAVFGTVTEAYTSFDVDKVARALEMATHPEARGSVTYDGYRARFTMLFHSNVQPEDYVAGEFFRAGIVVTTDDTGGGSCLGETVILQNLCLNLIIIDKAKQPLFRIRHVGSVQKMAERIRRGIKEGLGKVDHFVKAWGYACQDDLTSYIPEADRGLPIGQAIEGFFNGMIERDLVPVRGRRIEVVKALSKEWAGDKSSATVHHKGMTRAALANAFTAYAHKTEQPSPWLEDEIQRAAGQFVQSKAPVPFLALPSPSKVVGRR